MSQPSQSSFFFLFLLLCPVLHIITSLLHLFCSSSILLHILHQNIHHHTAAKCIRPVPKMSALKMLQLMYNETVNYTTDKTSKLPINLIIPLSRTKEKNKRVISSACLLPPDSHTNFFLLCLCSIYTAYCSLLTSAITRFHGGCRLFM